MDSRSGGRTVPKDTTADRDTLNLHGYCAQVLSALVTLRLTSHRHSRSKSHGESLSKGRVWVVRVIGGWDGFIALARLAFLVGPLLATTDKQVLSQLTIVA
jgi:hypothetical protein